MFWNDFGLDGKIIYILGVSAGGHGDMPPPQKKILPSGNWGEIYASFEQNIKILKNYDMSGKFFCMFAKITGC
jgi:hypothetical protein